MLTFEDDAAGGPRAEFFPRILDLVAERVLHAHVERDGDAVGRSLERAVETEFETGRTVTVGIGRADHLHGGEALRIVALLGGIEFEAGQAQMDHAVLRVGRQPERR